MKMHAIKVQLSVNPRNNFVSIGNWVSCINSSHREIFDWFTTLIDRNVIINKIHIDADGTTDTTFYYANSDKNARLFVDKFQNQSLNFSVGPLSMKQFWNKFEFDIDFELEKIDFNNTLDLLDLVNPSTGEIWNTKFPLVNPYNEHGNLQ